MPTIDDDIFTNKVINLESSVDNLHVQVSVYMCMASYLNSYLYRYFVQLLSGQLTNILKPLSKMPTYMLLKMLSISYILRLV